MIGRPQHEKRLLIQDKARQQDVEVKHERVRGLLKALDADGLLLQDPASIAWFTAGADLNRCASEDCNTSIFVTPEARLFATNAVDSAQIFEREAFALGFQLKQREWFQPHRQLVSDLCRGRQVISDRGVPDTRCARRSVRQLRLPLTALEAERLRMLSHVAVHAVEATGHHLRKGMTEAEVAGEVSHRLLKRTVAATRIHVCADGRNERYRHWTFGEKPIERFAVISCVARRWGLHVGVTRTICLDEVPDALLQAYQKAVMVHATGLFFSRAGQTLGDIWKKVHRIYEKFGMADEWRLADQASVVGFSASECPLTPESGYEIAAPSPIFWHPSVGPAMVGDTLLCLESSNEQLTLSASWPQISVRVKGREVTCPGILLIPAESSPRTPESGSADVHRVQSLECPNHPAEDTPSPVESAWEMRVPSQAIDWQHEHSRPSQDSVWD
ncbi:MAG: M24 family metallopeptidase [Fuerstiella sp.]